MRKNSIYYCINIIVLQGLYLVTASFGIKSLVVTAEQTTTRSQFESVNILNHQPNRHQTVSKVNKVNQKYREKLPLGKVWVVGEQKEVRPESFNWVVNDTKKAAQQPYLELDKQQNKPETKPSTTSKPAAKDNFKNFDTVIKDTDISKGLFTIYRDKEKNKIYLEVQPNQLKKNYLATATLESGIGEAGIYSGMPLQDFLFYFERVNNNLNFVVRNVNFRTQEGDPQSRSLARSFSDSVLYRVKIQSIHPQRKSILIDLGDLLLADLAGLSGSLGVPGTQEESYFGSAKVFPENIEIQSILNFSGGSSKTKNSRLTSLADKRGFTLKLHYSLSQLPDNNYRPRLADERVGYFITAYQDLSSKDPRDSFVRYINRWNLEKKHPNASISEPKKPIVYWIDNATPYEYREAIKEGVLMWNRAFETAGFKNAIEVKQMPDSATWDPSDIRYNTIRWINTVDGYFAMGPSRVNPLTGEILDADILLDASLVTSLKKDYQQIVQPTQSENRTSLSAMMQNRLLCNNSLNVEDSDSEKLGELEGFVESLSKLAGKYDLCYGIEATNQFGYGKLALSLLRDLPPTSQQTKDYIHQYLRLIVAHEVGHTLGLRHNFRGSTMLSPKEMNDKSITRLRGQVSSVMDYIPPNIAPEGVKQGDYFPSIIGPYDAWAIKYGYAEFKAASTTAEKPFLQKIAQESDKPEYSYATDEDVYDLDPTADAWDNSSNVLLYSKWQMDNARQMWDRINKRYPLEGESYSDVRDRFGAVLSNYFQQIYYTSKYIAGQSFYRVYASKDQNRLPFEPVSLEKQRNALSVLDSYIFAEDAFNFSPELLNKLAPSRWRHWGSNPQVGRLDYPIHDLILFMQNMVLSDLLSSDRLSRLKDIELKSEKGEALSLPELFNTLQDSIWTEVLKSKDKDLEISSLRRGLQRKYLDILTNMVLRKVSVPDDARTLAWYKLRQLGEKLEEVNSKDEYTKAHLLETRQRINKVLDAPLQTN
ncbi:MAG: zinc-dependent metalloprotease [Nostocales cyanobacterium 94392]|nr:zinc-dependent metalloprotease [Nostocales cyanobacterium 94392]